MVHGRRRRVRSRRCSTRVIIGAVTFTTGFARATLARGRVIYATGGARAGRLVLHARRPVRRGRYTLILSRREGRRWITTRRPITIT